MKSLICFVVMLLNINSFSQEKDIFDLARKGSKAEITAFFEANKDADCNTKNNHGFTPLILACYYSNQEAVKSFLEHDAQIDYNSKEGTALMAATVKGNVQLAKLLLENGANPNLTNMNGVTALMYAVQFENKQIVENLLQYKADKKILDKKGASVFEYAIQTKNEEIINLLKQ